MAGKKRIRISDQVRHAINTCGKTRYRIWQETGVAQPTLSDFMAGKRGLSMKALDKVGDCLGLNITMEAKSQRRKGGK